MEPSGNLGQFGKINSTVGLVVTVGSMLGVLVGKELIVGKGVGDEEGFVEIVGVKVG